MSWQVLISKTAKKDVNKLIAARLWGNARKLIDILGENPYQTPPPFEKLQGNLAGLYSRRINIQHRLVYQMLEEEQIVRVLQMWTHYK